MLLSCQNLGKTYGEERIVRNVSFQVNENEKIAMIGANGAGKSTILKMIANKIEPDEGQVSIGKNVTIGYLAQYQGEEMEGTIYDIVLSSKADIIAMEQKIQQMEEAMTHVKEEELNDFMASYHELVRQFELRNGYAYKSEVSGVLRGLGFAENDFGKTMEMLSGGEKTRVSLGKLLVSNPDLLLLDEPINHLDLTSIQWLETFLLNYKGAVLIVAHDRFFLDKIVSRVIEITRHEAKLYKGNYTQYAQQKEQINKTLQREYIKSEKEIAHQQEVIEKLKQFNREKSIKRAESRQKALDKLAPIERPVDENTRMQLALAPELLSGKDVLTVTDLKKQYESRCLFQHLSFEIKRGERVAILGDNGTGKTTILKIVNGLVQADGGQVRVGSNVTIGYYDQEQQVLEDSNTLFQEMQNSYPDLNNTRIRNVLAAFLFTGEDVFKRIGDLSGGERGRVSLAKLMLSGCNFLILDEPTNHLDMESREILENALNAYEGTVLYVSHDRYFVNKTAGRILELRENSFHQYLGNYDYYIEKKQQEEQNLSASISSEENTAEVSEGKVDWARQKELAAIKRKQENAIAKIEAEIADLEHKMQEVLQEFSRDEVATNSARLNELSAMQNQYQSRLDELYEDWEHLME